MLETLAIISRSLITIQITVFFYKYKVSRLDNLVLLGLKLYLKLNRVTVGRG
jgi:hypothetical protein